MALHLIFKFSILLYLQAEIINIYYTIVHGAGQPKPALHPKFSENPGMLNYWQSRKTFKNNSSGNSIDNPF